MVIFKKIDSNTHQLSPDDCGQLPMQPAQSGAGKRALYLAKRSFDIVAALALLVLALPLMIFISLLVALDGGPVFCFSSRAGAKGTFKCVRFRTTAAGDDELLDDQPNVQHRWLQDRNLVFGPRVSPLGRSLRRTGLDELPQLINVIRGEMSLVDIWASHSRDRQ